MAAIRLPRQSRPVVTRRLGAHGWAPRGKRGGRCERADDAVLRGWNFDRSLTPPLRLRSAGRGGRGPEVGDGAGADALPGKGTEQEQQPEGEEGPDAVHRVEVGEVEYEGLARRHAEQGQCPEPQRPDVADEAEHESG